MNLESKPTGSVTDKLFSILEGAAVLMKISGILTKKINKQRSTVVLARHEVEMTAASLLRAATMIDSLLSIIEQRENAKLDKYGNLLVAKK